MKKINKRRLFTSAGIIVFAGLICFAISNKGKSILYEMFQAFAFKKTIPTILPEDFKVQAGTLVLDAREKREFNISHLPNAVWIGYSDFHPARVESFPRDTSILLYCTVGYRSEKIGRNMNEMGFTQLSNLKGGILEWSNKGYIVSNDISITDSVHVFERAFGYFLTRGIKVW